MKFLSAAQEAAYKKALQHSYKAIAFDIDGTLTEFARFTIPDSMMMALNALPPQLPLLLCTGRPFEFIKGKINNIIRHAQDPEAARKQWTIIADNGGSAYTYNEKKDDYEALFHVPWPEERIAQETLRAFIKDRFGWHVVTDTREHTMVVIYHKHLYLFPRLVRQLSGHTAKQLNALFTEMDLHQVLKVQNSGLGSLIIPIESGKGHAIERWAKHAKIDLKDVLCIGDSPQVGGNDEDFLSGNYGVPFSVGKQTPKLYPLPVLDEKGKKLWGPKGTEYLVRHLFN